MTEENNSSSLLQFMCLARGVATLKTMRCDAHNPYSHLYVGILLLVFSQARLLAISSSTLLAQRLSEKHTCHTRPSQFPTKALRSPNKTADYMAFSYRKIYSCLIIIAKEKIPPKQQLNDAQYIPQFFSLVLLEQSKLQQYIS